MNYAAQPTAFQPDDLFRFKFVNAVALSPDGSTVVYTVSHVDEVDDKEYVNLWLLSLDGGGEPRQLTSGPSRDTDPEWSPDGRQIGFLSDRGDKPQIYVVAAEDGEPRALTAMPQGAGDGPVWSPDGKWLAFSAGPQEDPPDPKKPYRLTRRIIRYDGLGYLDRALHDLYLVPAEGGAARRLTHDGWHNTTPAWSPDGREILYQASMKPDSKYPDQAMLRVLDLDGNIRDVAAEWGYVASAAWSVDGRRIVFTGAPHGRVIDSRYDLMVVDRLGGVPESRTAGLKYGVGTPIAGDAPSMRAYRSSPAIAQSRDGSTAFVQVLVAGAMQIYRVALAGPESWAPIVQGDRACLVVGGDERRLLFGAATMHSPADLYTVDGEGGNEQRLTALNADLLASKQQPTVERLEFAGPDGVPVEAWIMLPTQGTAPYPTIVYSHGGPNAAYGHNFAFDFHMLAGAGYAVLYVNYRGSTGYGYEFATQANSDLGNLDHADVMAGLEAAIARGLSDPDRLGCCGTSYGGYLTTWAVGHTQRFKAAVAEAPVTNFTTMYAGDVPGWLEDVFGGPPYEVPERYARSSPITYAHHARTPTLLMVGEHDFRCQAEQTEQFYAILKSVGCVTEMVRFPESSHAGSITGTIATRRAQNEALLDWMQRYNPIS